MNAIMAKYGATSNPVIEKCLDVLTGGDKNIEFDKMTEGLGQAPFYTITPGLRNGAFVSGTTTLSIFLAI